MNSLRLNPTAPAQEQPPIQQARAVEGLNLPIKQLESEVHVRCSEYLQSQVRHKTASKEKCIW